MSKTELAPIVLFVYNRLEHTIRTIEALKNNELANQSDLIIYSDAPKNYLAEDSVRQVREYIKTVDGFRSVKTVERDTNWGLAKSIIDGVTSVVNQYGQIIVLEDDIVTSPSFLIFMNKALDFFKLEQRVWHISGWNYPIDSSDLGDIFFWRLMNCWGWATWKDRWAFFEKNPEQIDKGWTAQEKLRFNLDGAGDSWRQISLNLSGRIDTWAVFWYATIFQNHGLCVNPSVTFVENIGFDGTGIHCAEVKNLEPVKLNYRDNLFLDVKVKESQLAVNRIRNYYLSQKVPLVYRLVRKFKILLREICCSK